MSDTFRISQIDNSSLLINQRIKVYVSLTDEKGISIKDIGKESFTLYELAHGSRLLREVLSLEEGVNIIQGVNFLLIIDNSGSMYWDATGKMKNSENEEIWRITAAKRAVLALLREIKNPLDRVGLVSFNVRIDERVEPTDDKVLLERALIRIDRPTDEEAYTELYETLYHSVAHLALYRGRRVIIVLSDGVDFPMEANPHFPERFGIDGVIDLASREGISIFTIGLSRKADRGSLTRIARETGGAFFPIEKPEEIGKLYYLIRDQILGEYLLTYSAGMIPAQKKLVLMEYSMEDPGEKDGGILRAQRHYFSQTIFGVPQVSFQYLIFLSLAAAVLFLWLLWPLQFERKIGSANLSVYRGTGKGRKVQTHLFSPQKKTVTVGASVGDDLTITGDGKVVQTAVKIERKGDTYTIIGSGGQFTVNNRDVRTKVLRSGDLIKLGDTTIVFDAGVKKK
jgi:Ca-activated chloride channel family protein